MPRYQAPLRDMKFLLNEVLEIGQEVKVKVINVDREKKRIGLSMRALQDGTPARAKARRSPDLMRSASSG